jgi:F0F1-type ATP synthase membrane subunit b/b'
MEKKLSTREEQAIDWLKNEIEKDKTELNKEKQRFIDSLKDFRKEEIVKPKEKLTLWKKIKKVLTGY